MAQLYLPTEHTDADLVLAGQIAESIGSAELYVVWTAEQTRAIPELVAELRDAPPSLTALVVQGLRELWTAMRHQPAPGPRAPRRGAERRGAAA